MVEIAYRIGTNLLFLDLKFMDWRTPLWIRELTCVAAGGVLPVAVILLATWLAERRYGAPALAALAAVMLTVCIGESPDTWRRWSSQRFPPALVAQFAPWKALLPENAEIFWSEEPLATWVFLDRPSYISVSQSAGVMFSRTSAMDLLHRAQALDHVVPVTSYLDFDSALGAGVGPSPEQLDKVCAALPSGFVVAYAPLSWQPVAQLPEAAWHSLGALRLYRCADQGGITFHRAVEYTAWSITGGHQVRTGIRRGTRSRHRPAARTRRWVRVALPHRFHDRLPGRRNGKLPAFGALRLSDPQGPQRLPGMRRILHPRPGGSGGERGSCYSLRSGPRDSG